LSPQVGAGLVLVDGVGFADADGAAVAGADAGAGADADAGVVAVAIAVALALAAADGGEGAPPLEQAAHIMHAPKANGGALPIATTIATPCAAVVWLRWVAAFGVPVTMMSARGLGHIERTLDEPEGNPRLPNAARRG
jgi:hypothetical protein